MREWWDENWQWATGTIIAIVGILISLTIGLWQRRPTQLDYRIVTNVPILATGVEKLGKNLEVEYGGVRLQEPHLVRIRFTNTGKRAITSQSYEIPIAVSYEESYPLDAFVSDTSNRRVAATILGFDPDAAGGTDPAKLYIRPGLLNPGEWLEVQLISDGRPGEIFVSARFADQSKPMRNANYINTWREYFALSTPGAIFASLGAMIILAGQAEWIGYAALVLGALGFATPAKMWRRSRRHSRYQATST